MSKIKELFGVEIGEKFDIKDKTSSGVWNWQECYFNKKGQLQIPGLNHRVAQSVMCALLIGKAEIIKFKKPILTEEEREYLKAVFNPKFHTGTIETVTKWASIHHTFCLMVDTTDCEIYLFTLDKGLFEGMKLCKPYTLEELGL